MRQLYNFISTYSFYFFATPSKTMFFFLLMFCIIVSKTDFFYKGCIAFGLDNFDMGERFRSSQRNLSDQLH